MATKKGQIRRTSRRAFTGLTKRRSTGVSKAKFMKLEASKKALSARYRKLKTNAASSGSVMKTTALTSTGGAAAGALNAYYPEVMGVPSPLIAGAAMVAYAAFSGDDKWGGHIAAIGAGCLSTVTYEFVSNGLSSGSWTLMEVAA